MVYDILVVGGGIHGVGIAQAAAAAGYSVLVLEQTGWASATSSRSSKLIHGGLRYLQNGQLGLVRRCLSERRLLLELAPELVQLNDFYIPRYRDSYYPGWQISLGLGLYQVLAGESPFASSHLPRHQWSQLDGLQQDQLQAVYCYRDAQTDDRLLTLAVKASARELGANFCCPAQMVAAHIGHGSVRVDALLNEKEVSFHAKVMINAAGPWVSHVMTRINPGLPRLPAIELVSGSHLVLRSQLSRRCFYLQAADRRVIFLLPWQGKTLVGTTEQPFTGEPGSVSASAEEIDYLLTTVHRYFPQADLSIDETFAGVRVLPVAGGAAFSRVRETRIYYDCPDNPKVVALYGGKLTDYRAVSEGLVDSLADRLGPSSGVSTATISLSRTLAIRERDNPFEMI
ncbi:FAD-dependent oxidoreductase [Amphritea sp. HPY]|uniref:FAD-dependent oxidoreductase n=1 Tax=Amphritea sp. HPY TaxID=3421652 RepID=UPI003D7C5514